ncbi:hypothetical protein [Desulfosarcina sp.]
MQPTAIGTRLETGEGGSPNMTCLKTGRAIAPIDITDTCQQVRERQ